MKGSKLKFFLFVCFLLVSTFGRTSFADSVAPVAEWRYNGGSLEDYSGNGHTGYLNHNAQISSNGHNCEGLYLPNNGGSPADNTYDLMYTDDAPDLRITGNLTIMLWIYRTEDNDAGLVTKNYDPNNPANANHLNEYWFAIRQGGNLSFGDNGINGSITADTKLGLNQWYHVAVVRNVDARQVCFYVNGQQRECYNYNASGASPSSYKVSVGACDPCWYPFKGYIDEVKIYNVALSSDEIQEIYDCERTGSCDGCTSSDSGDGGSVGGSSVSACDYFYVDITSTSDQINVGDEVEFRVEVDKSSDYDGNGKYVSFDVYWTDNLEYVSSTSGFSCTNYGDHLHCCRNDYDWSGSYTYIRLRGTSPGQATVDVRNFKVEGDACDSGNDCPSRTDSKTITVNQTHKVRGKVWYDPNGDGDISEKQKLVGVTVKLFKSDGTLIATTTTDSYGDYEFTDLPSGDYYVVVDSKTISPPEGFNSGYGQGDVWAEQTWVNAPSAQTSYTRAICNGEEVEGSHLCYGGAYGDRSDDASALERAEHKILVHIENEDLGYCSNTGGLDFAFSFNVVTNVNDRDDDPDNGRTCQGCLRQFIQNANAISGYNYMRFVPVGDPNLYRWWKVTLNQPLPPIKDSGTAIDGTAYDYRNGRGRETNYGAVYAPGTAGVDGTELPPYLRPELEIDGNSKGSVFVVNADDTTIRRVAVFNTGWDTSNYPAAVYVVSGNPVKISDCFLGARADGSFPDVDEAAMVGVKVRASAGYVYIYDNYIAGVADTGISMEGVGYIDRNYISRVGRRAQCADGISFEYILDSPYERSRNAVIVKNNYIEKSAAYGIETWGAPGAFTISDNTIVESGRGNEDGDVCGDGNLETTELGGIRLFGSGSLVEKNVIHDNPGSGVVVVALDSDTPSKQNTITQNVFYNNGGISIDLDQTHVDGTAGSVNPNGDGVSPNDGQKGDNQQNGGLDYPIFTVAYLDENTLHVEGYVGTESSKIQEEMTIEIYKADDDGNNNGEVFEGDGLNVPHGEGRWYLGSCNTDENGTFSCDIDVSGKDVSAGDKITATATDSDGNTSEFSPNFEVSEAGKYTISGFVYNDANHSSTRENSEGGLGSETTVYVKLCQDGNVVQTVTPDSDTGYYEFTGLQAGNYTVVESADDSDSCSEGAPAGWVPTTGLSADVAVSSDVSGINFGNYHGEKACGYVFNDKGDGSASSSEANDAVFEPSVEKGIEKVKVKVCSDTACSSVIEGTVTDGLGRYCLWIPSDYESQTVYIVEEDPSGMVSTGSSVGSDVRANSQNSSAERNRLSLNVSSGTTVDNYNFGDVKKVQVAPPQSYTVSPGSTLTISHEINVSTPGALDLVLMSGEGWSYAVYTDDDCDGNPDSLVPLDDGYFKLTNSNAVSSGRLCFVIKVKVPSSAGAVTEKLDVLVLEDWKNTSGDNGDTNSVYDDTNSLVDTITVNAAQSGILKLTKLVRNVSRGEDFRTSNRAKPCEILEYKVSFKNLGTEDVVKLVISDVISSDVELKTGVYNGKDVKLEIEGNEYFGSFGDNPDTDGVVLKDGSLEIDVGKLTGGQYESIQPNTSGSFYYRVMLKGDCSP